MNDAGIRARHVSDARSQGLRADLCPFACDVVGHDRGVPSNFVRVVYGHVCLRCDRSRKMSKECAG